MPFLSSEYPGDAKTTDEMPGPFLLDSECVVAALGEDAKCYWLRFDLPEVGRGVWASEDQKKWKLVSHWDDPGPEGATFMLPEMDEHDDYTFSRVVTDPLKIYVAGPYSATRADCLGCDYSPRMACQYVVDGAPGPNCQQPDMAAREANIQRASLIGRQILLMGHVPFVPHTMSKDWDILPQVKTPYEEILRMDLAWVGVCDALYYIAPSPGTDRERAEAERLGKPIYETLYDIPKLRVTR